MAGQGPSANVRDVTTLEKARWALVAYREEIQQGLIEAQAEVARFTNWLEQQRPQELAAQMQRTKRELENAKADLTRAEMMQSNMGTSADTERKRVQRAKKKIEDLLRQREALKRWRHRLQQERSLFTAATSQLAFRVDSIFPSLEADLKNRRDALAAYLATLAPKSNSNEDRTP